MGRPRIPALALGLAVLLSGCTYADTEPGLFTDPTPSTSSEPEPGPGPSIELSPVNPALPVVGERVWTTGDGTGLRVRIAVHAVRRTPGATVLDYSLTPLPDGAHRPGSLLPSTVDLALLGTAAGDPQIFLVEPRRRKLYRPLTRGRWHGAECLCTPVGLVQQNLRVGRTQLMQVVFPELPPAVGRVDVDVASVPPFGGVAVTGEGSVPRVGTPYELIQPAAVTAPAGTTTLRTTAGGQEFEISVDTVETAPSLTALAWTIRSRTAGPGLAAALEPPFREAGVAQLGSGPSAGAPTVVPSGQGGPVLRSRLVTAGGRRRCLCTDLSRPGDSLAEPGRAVRAVTVLPPLPAGTDAVDVRFPGAGTVRGVRTTVAVDAAGDADGDARSVRRDARSLRRDVGTWAVPGGPPMGWSVEDWPTPLPSTRGVDRFRPVVSDLVR